MCFKLCCFISSFIVPLHEFVNWERNDQFENGNVSQILAAQQFEPLLLYFLFDNAQWWNSVDDKVYDFMLGSVILKQSLFILTVSQNQPSLLFWKTRHIFDNLSHDICPFASKMSYFHHSTCCLEPFSLKISKWQDSVFIHNLLTCLNFPESRIVHKCVTKSERIPF